MPLVKASSVRMCCFEFVDEPASEVHAFWEDDGTMTATIKTDSDVYYIEVGLVLSKGLCKSSFFLQKPRLLWKWVNGSRSHSEFFVWKIIIFLENIPKPVIIFWSRIPCIFCLYMHC